MFDQCASAAKQLKNYGRTENYTAGDAQAHSHALKSEQRAFHKLRGYCYIRSGQLRNVTVVDWCSEIQPEAWTRGHLNYRAESESSAEIQENVNEALRNGATELEYQCQSFFAGLVLEHKWIYFSVAPVLNKENNVRYFFYHKNKMIVTIERSMTLFTERWLSARNIGSLQLKRQTEATLSFQSLTYRFQWVVYRFRVTAFTFQHTFSNFPRWLNF